ncbi:MAG: CYTH domain-containing protein [Gammaproteobacteria bacterium]|nr:CYTH domain-containing protein [Gammaproteobacteria bacterium]
MPVEIERKFLVKDDSWFKQVNRSTRIRQGYLSPGIFDASARASVRVRIEDDKANINIKSATLGMRRMEYEYEIPVVEAKEMLDNLCGQPQIDKNRHLIRQGQHTWEVDEFFGVNAGLYVAEIELATEDEDFEKPGWLGKEVTEDPRYYNVNLVKHPYKDW